MEKKSKQTFTLISDAKTACIPNKSEKKMRKTHKKNSVHKLAPAKKMSSLVTFLWLGDI